MRSEWLTNRSMQQYRSALRILSRPEASVAIDFNFEALREDVVVDLVVDRVGERREGTVVEDVFLGRIRRR